MSPRYKSVLIIEDDESIRSTLQELLMMEGYHAHVAENGKQGLELLRSLPEPCLILLDMMMPEMNGWEFMEVRRKTDLIAAIPVIVISAAASRKGLNEIPKDATAFLKKPIELDRLLGEVMKHCQDAAQAA